MIQFSGEPTVPPDTPSLCRETKGRDSTPTTPFPGNRRFPWTNAPFVGKPMGRDPTPTTPFPGNLRFPRTLPPFVGKLPLIVWDVIIFFYKENMNSIPGQGLGTNVFHIFNIQYTYWLTC